jgi:hypothetical protein
MQIYYLASRLSCKEIVKGVNDFLICCHFLSWSQCWSSFYNYLHKSTKIDFRQKVVQECTLRVLQLLSVNFDQETGFENWVSTS